MGFINWKEWPCSDIHQSLGPPEWRELWLDGPIDWFYNLSASDWFLSARLGTPTSVWLPLRWRRSSSTARQSWATLGRD